MASQKVRTTEIKNTRDLRRADHIAWYRQEGYYYHHALVVEVSTTSKTKIKVIHYGSNGGSSLKSLAPGGATVKEEWVDAFPDNDILYRYDYKPGKCYPSDVVIRNARKRLGESKYNVLTNNCEHFARSCKTGRNESYQSTTAEQVVNSPILGLVMPTSSAVLRGALHVMKQM